MTSRNETSLEYFGKASPGWGKPSKFYSRDQAGGNTPRIMLAKHKYSENPYRLNLVWRIVRQISWRDYISGQPTFMHSASFGSSPVFDSVSTPSFTEVTPKLLENWRASKFSLGVTIGEGRESVELITSRLRDIARAAQAVRRRNLGDALRYLSHVPKSSRRSAQFSLSVSALTDAWLELQYGWLPLIKDISNAAEFVKLEPRQNRVRARSVHKGGASPLGTSIPQSRVKLFNNDRRIQQIVVVSSQPDMMERLGLADPMSIGWELVPFSFVVDWFSPISDYLATLHAITAMPVTQCVQTISSRQVANVEVLSGDLFFGSPVLSGGTTSYIQVVVDRTVSPSLPLAWVASAQTPSEIDNAYEPSLQRLANASALVSSSLRGLSHR